VAIFSCRDATGKQLGRGGPHLVQKRVAVDSWAKRDNCSPFMTALRLPLPSSHIHSSLVHAFAVRKGLQLSLQDSSHIHSSLVHAFTVRKGLQLSLQDNSHIHSSLAHAFAVRKGLQLSLQDSSHIHSSLVHAFAVLEGQL
jgi:hypothetical protein